MTQHDKFAMLIQTECITQVHCGDMSLPESQVVMGGIFTVPDRDVEAAFEAGESIFELAHAYISWKVCDTVKPNWIK